MADGSRLHGLNNLVGNGQNRVAGKAGEHFALACVFGKAGQRQSTFDNRRKVLVFTNMRHTGPGDQAGGEDILHIAGLGLLNAVGGHKNGPGKLGKLFFLILPGGAVVAVKMTILFQFRVAVAGQHLAVGVDVDALALGLLQQKLQIAQIVAGNQDGLALTCAKRNRSRYGVAVLSCVGGVQKFHGAQVDFSTLKHPADPVFQPKIGTQGSRPAPA